MEPLRGGMLTDKLPESLVRIFRDTDPDRSLAEWALRWVLNHKEVTVVLSGMSTEDQLTENIMIASQAGPGNLTAAELQVFERVKHELASKTKVPCTACGYCMPCPFGVNIPGCFSLYNEKFMIETKQSMLKYYQTLGAFSVRPGFASMCTKCGRCELHCPQHIAIREELRHVRDTFEKPVPRTMIRLARKLLPVTKKTKKDTQ